MLLKLMTENGKLTGNGKIGNRESGTGNKCTAVTRLTIQNGVQRERKGNYLAKREEVFGCKSKYLMVSSPDDQYVLVKAESD